MNLRYNEVQLACHKLEAVAIAVPWKSDKKNYYDRTKEIQKHEPSIRHILIVGDVVPEGAHSLEEILKQPLEKDYPDGYLETTRFPIDEVAVIGLTSGTSGIPKFIEHPILSRIALGRTYANSVNLCQDDTLALVTNSILGGAASVGYSGGAPLAGARVALLERWNVEDALRLLEKEKVTVLRIVPTQLIMILKHPDLDKYKLCLRAILCGSAPLPWEMAREAEKRLGIRIVTSYGCFDGALFSLSTIDQPDEVRWKTSGKPPVGIEIRLVDDSGKDVPTGQIGEVIGRGALTISGHFKDINATIDAWGCLGRDGWFKTGDLARFDESGNLSIVGRKKDMVLRGGQNIYPQEIENLLLTHPKVGQVAVVSMPDPVMGERACAYVAPKRGKTFTFDEMTSFLKDHRIASFKIPERLEIRDILPIGELGKVMKHQLVEDIQKMLQIESKV
jgi:non-ribosomal peptide synthetase component E (peptide arylation enzyme)